METLCDLKSYGEPGAVVYLADCVELMRLMPASCVDMVFADPPYRLSGGGVTVRSGRVAPVDKGEWDRSRGFVADHEFNVRWLKAARRVLKPDGTLWVSGTHHIIFSLGFALQSLDFRIIKLIQCKKSSIFVASSVRQERRLMPAKRLDPDQEIPLTGRTVQDFWAWGFSGR